MSRKSLVLMILFGCLPLFSPVFVISPCFAQDKAETQTPKTPEKSLRIITDQAIVDSKARYTEFTGHVKMTINDTRIDADWIKVTFHEDIKKISSVSIDEKSIDTINAKGNVKILMNDMVANTNEALYTSANDTYVLTGENSTLISGENTLVSDKITINMKDQTFKAESAGGKPVEAIFYNKPEPQK